MTIEQERLTPTQEEIERLEELLAKASPQLSNGSASANVVAEMLRVGHEMQRPKGKGEVDYSADAALIVEGLAALPTLLAALKSPPIAGGEGLLEKLELWFFRDCNLGTRRCLFALFGMPLDEITSQAIERKVFRHILAAQPAEERVGGAEDAVALPCPICGTSGHVGWHCPMWGKGSPISDDTKLVETLPTTSGDVGKLCERLRASAQSSSHVQQMMAEGKSLRNSDGEHKDLYMWPEPEQTLEGQAAAILTQMEAREQALREALERVKRLERSIMIDVRTAHSGRGNGASSEMRSDDRDMVSELRDTFAEIDSLLAGAGS